MSCETPNLCPIHPVGIIVISIACAITVVVFNMAFIQGGIGKTETENVVQISPFHASQPLLISSAHMLIIHKEAASKKSSTTMNSTISAELSIQSGSTNQEAETPEFILNVMDTSIMDRDENLARIEIATLALIFLTTVLGNATVLLALWTRKRYCGRKKLSRMYFFILHLSVADLIVAFFSVLPQLAWEITYRFKGGFVLCKVVKYGQTLGPYLSSYVLMATALDRHQAICYPLTYCSWTSRRAKTMVYIAWMASLLFCVPQVMIFSYQEVVPKVYDCWATFSEEWGEQAYVIWYSVSIFIVPLIVLLYTYSCICREIWRCSNSSLRPPSYHNSTKIRPSTKSSAATAAATAASVPMLNSNSHRQRIPIFQKKNSMPLISRAKINTVKQTVAVIVMYIVCSTPFIIAQLWATISPTSSFLEGSTFTILTLLYSLNSCVNPWIYLAFNRELPRLLIRHLITSNENYRTPADGQTASNSSGEQFTSLKCSKQANHNSTATRSILNGRKWMVTAT